MRKFLFLLAALLLSVVFGGVVGYIGMETLPCHWFGTGFEGACAYGVLWVSIGTGLAAGILLFACLCYRVLRRPSQSWTC
jgi:hypothetical protein